MTQTANFEVRRGDSRGTTDLGWLKSKHSFSFGQYRDPSRMGYRSLRVLNDDVVAPGSGFGEHGHSDMEIISIVLEGALAHRDSTGTAGVIAPGDVQVMSAGSGIRHSEMNGSETEPVHFLQVWIEPAQAGTVPGYAQQSFDAAGRAGAWQRIGGDGGMPIGQDAAIDLSDIAAGASIDAGVGAGRFGYLHVATGSVRIDGVDLSAGDAVTFDGGSTLSINGVQDAQILLFDLA
ncbi:MAG: pirin family protein [Planctomycetota bacterium]